MGSEPKGLMYIPVWVDAGVVKALVTDDGRIPVQLGGSDISLDVNLQASDITLPVSEQSPLTTIQARVYTFYNGSWQNAPTETDGSLHVHLESYEGTLLIQQYMPSLLQPGMNAYDGAAWHKQPLIWGFTDRWGERATGVSTGGAATNALTIAVPAGYVYKLEGWTIEHNDTGAKTVYLSCVSSSVTVQMYSSQSFAQNTQVYGVNQFTLIEDDQIQFTVWGLVSGKTAYLDVWGSIMKVDM